MVDIFKRHPEVLDVYQKQFHYILVDEVQDLNELQQEWLKLVVGENKHLTCVGDDDQMVYGFRGASGDFILNFEKHFKQTHTIKLEQNYRSTKKILHSANSIIAKNKNRKGKTLWTSNEKGEEVKVCEFADKVDECAAIVEMIKRFISESQVKPEDIAILTRTNADSRDFEKQLFLSQIPYELSANKKQFLQIKEVELALCYLLILQRPKDDFAWKLILNKMPGFGKVSLDKINEYAAKNQVSIIDICKHLIGFYECGGNSLITRYTTTGKRKPQTPVGELEKYLRKK